MSRRCKRTRPSVVHYDPKSERPLMSSSQTARLIVAVFSFAAFLLPPVATAQDGSRQTIVHNGMNRSYVVRTPGKLGPGVRVPLVFVLHGGGGNASNAEQ